VDLNRFAINEGESVRRSLGLRPRDIVVGTVGRLHPQKGQTYLLQAAPIIIKKEPNVRFVLIGDGESRNELEAQIRNAGLEKRFSLLGFRQDVHKILHAIDIFTLPSLYEGLPNVILEAMAAGKPVVATSVDGTKELVEHEKTGLLVSPGDPDGLAEAILRLIRNRKWARRMGREAREKIQKSYSIENQIRAFEELYESCLEKS
jgi:glycosyltransferase involved in cell wall biosynthesis